MLHVAALALRMPRRKHDRWGPYRFVASRGALQPTQSATVFRCHNPRSRVSAAVGMALLVLSTLATSAWGPHNGPHHRAPPSPPSPHSPHPRCRVCAALTPFTALAAHLSQPAPPHLP